MTTESSKPRVRAVVLNYNRAELTRETAQSLLAQQYDALDVVVVDNGSSPEQLALLKRALLRLPIHLVCAPRNLGYAAGNNFGVRQSGLPRAEYILVINNDVTLPDTETLTKLVDAVERRKPACVAASPLVNTLSSRLPVTEQIQVRRVPDYLTVLATGSWWLRRFSGLKRKVAWHLCEDQRPYRCLHGIECETVNGSCFLIATDFLERIGFFDEGTFLYHEELILGYQIISRRKEAFLVTATSVDHEQGATTGHRAESVKFSSIRAMAKSEAYYCRKYLKTPRPLVMLLVGLRYVDGSAKLLFTALRRIGSK